MLEPIASRLHFCQDNDLEIMARKAGYVKIRLDHPDRWLPAREVKLPEDVVAFFTGGRGDRLPLATC